MSAPQYITGYVTKGMDTQGGSIEDGKYIIDGNIVISPTGPRYDDGVIFRYFPIAKEGYNYNGFIINEDSNPAGDSNIVSKDRKSVV